MPSRHRVRLLAACVLLVGIAFLQSPGLTVADTKFDLAVSPVQFLGRALHLWDPTAAFGQLQNQAYGYLWPMGPFFALGHVAGLPGWVVQRLWLALVMCIAFLGAGRVARALGVRSDLAVILAGFAYATSPRMLTTVGPISIEAWPSALAPWVLLPLVLGSRGGSTRRAGLLSAVAVSMVGGVNAAATSAVLPLGVVWLLTRTNNRRRWSLLGWWGAFTLLGTAWWLIPLFMLGAYSPPFLDFIENADVTTFPATVFDALRGTTDWVPYVDPSWTGGHDVITIGFLALDAGLLIGFGLLGIVHRSQPERRFLLLALLVGLFLTTMGHQGSVQGWLAGPLNDALDGALAPLRNTHKFDPVVRLPLVLGIAHLVDIAVASRRVSAWRLPSRTWSLPVGGAVAGLACLAVVGAALPAYTGRLAPSGGVDRTPSYWSTAVSWLDEQGGGVALMTPGSSFGHYLWGTPRDEPAQYLAADSWAVRNAVPLAPAGNIRMLDALEARLAQGRGSDGLAPYLRRAGVRYIVVRNDLATDGDVPDDALVLQALADSPGLRLVKAFGPDVGGDPYVSGPSGRLVINAGWRRHRQALEVYAVDTGASTVASDALPVVVGGPEDLLDLADEGVLGDEPTQLAADVPTKTTPDGPVVLTDGMLDREQNFGRIHDGASAVRTHGDVRRTGNRLQDYAVTRNPSWRTTTRLIGAKSIEASSSRSDATAIGGSRTGELPFAAVDGDPSTQWVSDAVGGSAWWRITLPQARVLREVTLTLGDVGADRTTVRVATAAGESKPVTVSRGRSRNITLPTGRSDWLRVEAAGSVQLSLAEVAVPGLVVSRQLVLPQLPDGWSSPEVISLHALWDARTGCVEVNGRTPCLAERARPSEEPAGFTRVVTMPSAEQYVGSLSVVARPGAALDRMLQEDYLVSVQASSTGVADPRASGLAALDGSPGTTWIAAADDAHPTLDVRWLGARSVRTLTVSAAPAAPVRRPTEVLVSWDGGSEKVSLNDRGRGELSAPITVQHLSVEITASADAAWTDDSGAWHSLPVGVSRLRLGALTQRTLTLSDEERVWPCGSGPTIRVGDQQVPTRIVGSPADLYSMRPVTASPCGDIALAAGDNEVSVQSSDTVTPTSLVLRHSDAPLARVQDATDASTGSVTRSMWAPTDSVVVDQRENANPGWEAEQSGRALKPVVLDGWRQGWLTRSDPSPIDVRFAPDGRYRAGLGIGLVLLLLLWLVALVRRQRRDERLLPCFPASVPVPVLTGLGLVGCGLLAGWGGLLAGALGAALGYASRRVGADEISWALVVIGPLAAGAGYAIRPWGAFAGWAGEWAWPHYAAVVALGAALAVASPANGSRRSRMKGRSTTR
ncbi:alpha-(1-_3)-arabinofuranosyltransferase [Nocardioides sp. CER19]|uniref:alpha-(1->3)-arabinofuranosyltransferase n=1 Tax=Nocardioides sp. CER19 TaxID=3038538 RepID=UPI00244A6231|nr:alpha-(1->3)-arabinofuranosyltransferase [Nocardioides sp. CER19]MDH2416636.1 alpha-(1->3)-arabinofuranosyltransferase [Nocardioides sp. CER19]